MKMKVDGVAKSTQRALESDLLRCRFLTDIQHTTCIVECLLKTLRLVYRIPMPFGYFLSSHLDTSCRLFASLSKLEWSNSIETGVMERISIEWVSTFLI